MKLVTTDGRRTSTDAGACVYYKLTCEPSAQAIRYPFSVVYKSLAREVKRHGKMFNFGIHLNSILNMIEIIKSACQGMDFCLAIISITHNRYKTNTIDVS